MTFKKGIVIAIAAVLALPILLLQRVPQDPTAQQRVSPGLSLESSDDSSPALGFSHPEMFREAHRQIRASENGQAEYPVGYQIIELNKARAAAKGQGGFALNWVERGPGNVGGRTRPIIVDPDDPTHHTWLIGTAGGGVYRTRDGGQNWEPTTDHLPNLAVSALVMAESNHNILYMGTGEGFGNVDAIGGSGIFRSNDRGASWEHLLSTANNAFRYVNRMVVDPSDADIVLAATNAGIYRTTDGGASWSAVYQSDRRVEDLKAQPGNFSTLIASENRVGVLHSADGGLTWAVVLRSADTIYGSNRIELAYSPSHPAIAYGSVEGSSGPSEMIRSDDGGATWKQSHDIQADHYGPLNYLRSQGWYNNTIAVHPFSPDTVMVGGVNLYRAQMGEDTVKFSQVTHLSFANPGQEVNIVYLPGLGNSASRAIRAGSKDARYSDIAEPHNASVEIRYGQGTQMAHRFLSNDPALADVYCFVIGYDKHEYAGYVEVPFTAWETDTGRQLAVSFHDTANDSTFNLIRPNNSGTCDEVSNERVYVHRYDYDASSPHDSIAHDLGVTKGMMYMLIPALAATVSTWDPANVPVQTTSITYQRAEGLWGRTMDKRLDRFFVAHVDHHALVPIPIDEASNEYWVLNTNDGGVAISTNRGVDFTETDDSYGGQNTSQFYGVDKRPGLAQYLGGAQDNGSWMSWGNPDHQRSWVGIAPGDGFEALWNQNDGDKLIVTSQYNNLFWSRDRGTSWTHNADLVALDQGIFVTSIDNAPNAQDTVYILGQKGVILSHDFGESVELVSIDTLWWPAPMGKVRASLAADTVVWAGYGLDDGSPDGGDPYSRDRRLWYSTDTGRNFSPTSIPAIPNPPSTIISGLATHPTEVATAYALFSRYRRPKILQTNDFGATWTDISGFSESTNGSSTRGFPDVAVYDLLVMPHAPHVIWAATEIGIFKSKSHGNEWNYAHNGLPAVSVWRMKYRDDEIVVATHGRGVWTVPWAEIDVSTEDGRPSEVPQEFSLAQNYPNPFNPTTTINFSLPREVSVRLTVFDAIGRQVAVLTDRVYAAGAHELVWDASRHASGIYFYRMEAGGRLIQTQKMTLIK